MQWPQEVLAAAVCFPYVLTLQAHGLSAYSMVDQQHKQTLSIGGAKGLLATSGKTVVAAPVPVTRPVSLHQLAKEMFVPAVSEKLPDNHGKSASDGAFVFTERDVFVLRLVPLREQIQALVRQERVEEALLLLDGVQACCPLDSYMVRQKRDTQQSFCPHQSFYRFNRYCYLARGNRSLSRAE